MPDRREFRRLTPRGFFLYCIPWTVAGLFAGFQIGMTYAYADLEIAWVRAIGLGLAQWYAWALLYPVLAWAAARVPFGRKAWFKPLVVHLPLTIAISLVQVEIQRLLVGWIVGASVELPAKSGSNTAILICWILVGVAHAVLYYRQSQERGRRELELESELANARLQLLQRQLRPHFLFNTLNAITASIRHDPEAAEKMTTRLSDLLRLSLEQAGNERVPLQSEIRFAKLYAGIQQMRFSDRLTFEWDVDERALEAAVPAMLLQPLIENAVEHGLSRAGEPGRIRLAVEREGDRLRMTVRDNGPGPPTDGGDPGVGLDNTRKRLSTMYGDAAAITLVSDTEGGARVTIELPFEEAP